MNRALGGLAWVTVAALPLPTTPVATPAPLPSPIVPASPPLPEPSPLRVTHSPFSILQDLPTLAQQVRTAWAAQRASGVIGRASRVLLQLPGGGGRVAVSRDQAVRLVNGLFHRAEEMEVRVVASREVSPGQGYVELRRRYRMAAGGEERSQRVLLAYRRVGEGGGWELLELRVLDGGG